MTKSMAPSSCTHLSAAFCRLSGCCVASVSTERGRSIFVPWSTYIAHIATANSQHLGAFAGGGEVAGDGLGLLDATADNAGVGAQVDEGSRLRATYGAGASRDECDTAVYIQTSGQAVSNSGTLHTRSPTGAGQTHRRCRPSTPTRGIRIAVSTYRHAGAV